MGCDIHTNIEIKRTINGEEKWIDANYYKRNRYYDGIDEYEKEFVIIEPCDGRNYQRFAVLANVRNYGDTIPISEPKGIPDDCCDPIKKEYESWGNDAHSASYFTLRELIEYQNSNPSVKYSGLISKEQANALDEKGIHPTSWCQGTNANGYVRRSWTEKSEVIDPIIEEMKQRLSDEFWVNEEDKRFNQYTDKIRFVFWFDN